ncbi:protein kinase domain-containing protein [Oryzobacter telluris]|uniref:protein kinase domain-containing protein n=1 Tax=Oryzobacter telluris TaxID=3149179 RepID=UPI00370D7598
MSDSDESIAGRYRLLRQIGAGGMGVVWLAHDDRLGRDVAVKLLHARSGTGDEDAAVASQRALREARITARLHHPHAVPVFDVVEHDGQPCLVMQYFPSVSLAELVAAQGPLSTAEVARIGAEVASALAAAHEVGIVHRDVKPANVLVGGDGAAKISDFGIAHALGDASLTTTGLVTGTPAYLAPEVARGEPSTPASDVFSLGSTLYTVLEGGTPFGTHENPMALLHRVASGDVQPPRRAGALAPLLLAMLAPRAQDRPTMEEVASRLSTVGGRDGAEPAVLAATAALPVVADDDDAPPADEAGDGDLLGAFRDRETTGAAPSTVSGAPRGRRGVLVVALALAAVAVAVVAVVLAAQGRDADTAAPQRSTTSSSAAPSTPTPSPSSPAATPSSPPPTSAAPSPTPTPTPAAATGTPTAAQLAGALRDYYALLPADLDAGWARLTERYQRTTAGSRSTYGSFWGRIDRVRVSDVDAVAPDAVTATLRYEYADGRVFVERTSYRLLPQGGVLRIDRSTVLSSTER